MSQYPRVMRWFARQPLIVKLVVTAATCGVVVAGPVRLGIVRYVDSYDPTGYEDKILGLVGAVFVSLAVLVGITVWHLQVKAHRD